MAALENDITASPIDAAWAQVAELKPRLAPHVDIVQHSYRGELWYVLEDKMTATHFRCTPSVQQFLVLLDGEHSVDEAYQASTATDSEVPVEQAEIVYLLTELQSSQLLLGGVPPDSAELYERQQKLRRSRWLRRLASPLAVQIPLIDPDKFLQRALPWVKPFFSPLFLYLWFFIVAWTAVSAANQWATLAVHWESRFMDPGNLLSLWLMYPLVKGLHELGHGFATRVWGGEVHEMGVILLVFTPVPYVDASASSAFRSRHQRMVVAAAGIMVELLLAGVALWLWSYSDPGLLRDLCFNVMVIGGASTLLFNGNPLLRFDGYYVLTDLLEMPNLRLRANAYLGYLLKRYVLKLDTDATAPAGRRERAWLLSYAILAGIYRLVIGFTIALFIAGKYFFIGASLAIWLIIGQMGLPLYRVFSGVFKKAQAQSRLERLLLLGTASTTLLVLVLFVIPVGNSTSAEGIVKLPENAQIRTRAAGFILEIFKQNGQKVSVGEPLFQMQNLELQASEAVLLAKSRELAVRHNRALSGERVELKILKGEIASLQDEIREVQTQLDGLLVVSPHEGIFSLPRAGDLPGRFLEKGQLLGHVIDHSAVTVRVVIPQTKVDQVRRRTRTIQVRLASAANNTWLAGQVQEVPQATTELPSAVLGSREGGDIAVDARDRGGRHAITNIFQLDLSLPEKATGSYLGQRALVRFVHQREPLGIGWYRRFRQLLLSKIGV